MSYLCLSLAELPLEARQPASEIPLAVTERKGARRRLVACNAACRSAGIRPGLDATTALALRPDLGLIERSRNEEREAIKSLAGWAEQFSSWVCFDAERLLLWMEVGSGLRYFGGIDALCGRVQGGLAQLGYSGVLGIAPTLEAAALLCRVDNAPSIEHHGQLTKMLKPLPLAALALSDEVGDALAGMGLRTIGEVLALPRDSLSRRFGPELCDYLDRMIGAPDPRKPYRAPAKYRRRFELLGSVESSEALLFPLHRILNELQGFLVARDIALQSVHFDFSHEGKPPTRLEVRTTRPLRDAMRLFALIRERLERTEFPAATESFVVSADRFTPLGDTQLELLDSAKRRDEGWENLLDKLRARLGDTAVRQLGLRDDHLPERAWCVAQGKTTVPEPSFPERPLWLLEPRALRSLPQRIGLPERIESGWLQGNDESRDYYIAEAASGSRLWLYRDAGKGQWFLHGLWA